MSGGVLALLLSFLMMLEGTIGAHALGVMAATEQLSAGQVICSSGMASSAGYDDRQVSIGQGGSQKHGGTAERPSCCSAACQFVAQVAATDLPFVPTPEWPVPSRAIPLMQDYSLSAPRPQGRFMAARGPPAMVS